MKEPMERSSMYDNVYVSPRVGIWTIGDRYKSCTMTTTIVLRPFAAHCAEPPDIRIVWPAKMVSCLCMALQISTSHQLTVDPLSVLASKESHDSCNIRWVCTTAQGTCASHGRLDVIRRPALVRAGNISPCSVGEHIGFDTTRSNAVDGDSFLAKIIRHGPDKTFDGAFTAGIQRMVGRTHDLGSDGAHQDHPSSRLAVLVPMLADKELGTCVETKDLIV